MCRFRIYSTEDGQIRIQTQCLILLTAKATDGIGDAPSMLCKLHNERTHEPVIHM